MNSARNSAHALLRAGQRRDRRLLHKAGGIRGGLRLQLAQVGGHRLRRQRKARPPAGHRISFRQRPENDQVLLGPGERTARDRLSSVVQVHVALVQQQENPAVVGQVDDALQILGRDHRARRVRRRIQNDGLGARRDGALDGVCRDAEALGLAGFEIDHFAARVLDDVLEADPVGNRQNDLVAVVDKDLQRVEQRQLAAGRENGLVDRVVRAEVAGVALDDGFAHVGNARNHGVAGEIGLDGGNGGVLDVPRGGEVRLAGPEIHQVGALSAQFGRLGGHSHGRGYFDPANAIGKDFCWSCNGHNTSIFADFRMSAKSGLGKPRRAPLLLGWL